MSVVSILALVAAVLGVLCFFIAGFLAGRRGAGGQAQHVAALAAAQERLAQLGARLAAVTGERDRARADLAAAEQELSRAAEELGRAEAELSQAEGEIQRLSLSDITEAERSALNSTPPPLPFPDPDKARHDPIDDALSKFRPSLFGEQAPAEVDQLRAMAEMPTDMPPPPDGGTPPIPVKRDRTGAGFQTVSIASRNTDVPSVEHDRLRAAYDKLKREKDDLETEFARARQELQLLKLRGK